MPLLTPLEASAATPSATERSALRWSCGSMVV